MTSQFLGKFPKLQFDADRKLYGNKETVTNIFFRIGIIKKVLADASSYYMYNVQDGETPEILAHKVYGDAGAHWIIIYANDIYDPQFDWPISDDGMLAYISDKYRPQVNAATISKVVINDGGRGYSNGIITLTGGHGVSPNVNVCVNEVGTIVYANTEFTGTGYYMTDNVYAANVATLGGTGANLRVIVTPPTDDDVINYSANTIHHFEKVVQKVDSLTNQTQEERYWVDRNMLTNGVLYLANTNNINFQVGETANTNTFSGIVVSFDNVNNKLVLANTTGDFVLSTMLTGNTSTANGEIMNPAFDLEIYDYYNNLAETGEYTTINIDYYTVKIREFREAISLYDYEMQQNDKKKEIKVINPAYYSSIKNEFERLLKEYNPGENDVAMTVTGVIPRRLI